MTTAEISLAGLAKLIVFQDLPEAELTWLRANSTEAVYP